MIIDNIFREKKIKKDIIIKDNNLKNSKQALWLIKLDESLINQVFIDALEILPGNFIIITKNNLENKNNVIFTQNINNINWFDFIVCDETETDLISHLKEWIIPIIHYSHHIIKLLSEFNPKKVEWNSFIFENNAICDIYYAIIRYLENYKFPYDNKALVKNVLDV